jgi:hypothetical protein
VQQVYSNDNSRSASGHASPLRVHVEGERRQPLADNVPGEEIDIVLPVAHMLDTEELGHKVCILEHLWQPVSCF